MMKILALAFCLFVPASAQAAEWDDHMFLFRFALEGAPSPVRTVYFQAEHGTTDKMIRTCGFSGLACACELFDSTGNLLERSEALSYDQRGNYFRCVPNGLTALAVKARLVERREGGLASEMLDLKRSLTLHDLIGRYLDMNRVREIYRYTCEHSFLQKHGTTTQSFDCSNQPVSCDPDGTVSKNFCLLQARFPYHLFADSYSSNFQHRVADRFYNGGGSGRICGLQIKQFDCTGVEHMPVRTFGLFGEQVGYWDTSVQLVAGPDLVPQSYGFAARTSAETNECPPGLEKRVFFRAEVVTSDITPSHNFTSGLVSSEVFTPTATPSPFAITKLAGGSGGFCAGDRCSLPSSFAGYVKSAAYTSAGQTEFCVIPAGMLP